MEPDPAAKTDPRPNNPVVSKPTNTVARLLPLIITNPQITATFVAGRELIRKTSTKRSYLIEQDEVA